MKSLSAKNHESFEHLLRRSEVPVLAAFLSKDCRRCQVATSALQLVATAFGGRVTVVRLEVADSPVLATRYHVLSVPSLRLFKHGEVVYEFVGQPAWHDLESVLDRVTRAVVAGKHGLDSKSEKGGGSGTRLCKLPQPSAPA